MVPDDDTSDEEDDEDDDKRCENVFNKYPSAKCIAYDDGKCDDEDWSLFLKDGEFRTFSQGELYYAEMESISVRKGCQLKIWKGKAQSRIVATSDYLMVILA